MFWILGLFAWFVGWCVCLFYFVCLVNLGYLRLLLYLLV